MHIQTSNQEQLNLGFNNYTCNWGLHICGLYETEAERDEIILGFLYTGDIEGDLQLYCPVERTKENFIAAGMLMMIPSLTSLALKKCTIPMEHFHPMPWILA